MGDGMGALAGLLFVIGLIAAWFTHVVTCISTAKYLFLVAGAIFAPVGVIHGVGIWLNAW